MRQRLLSTYNPLPISFVRGQGVWLWDQDGNRYLDALSGVGVNILGYDQAEWVACIQQQASKLVHVSNIYHIPEQQLFSEKLCALTGMDKVFFANSGGEANETAIKLARLYGHSKGIDEPTIIVFDNAFHGRTLATLTASGSRQVQAGFEPLVSGFIRAPYNDITALQHIADTRHEVVAVLLEPIQGAGGVNVPSPGFFKDLHDLCTQKGWLLIDDEIQCGMGRTGRFLALQHEGIQPDILTLAKGLANGIPIAACLTHGIVNDLFSPGSHGSTFGGNPFGCTIGLKTLELLEKHQLITNAATQGEKLLTLLRAGLKDNPKVKDIRGKGLMIGIELQSPCLEIAKMALTRGLLVNVTHQNVIRLLPPLVIQSQEIEILVEKMVKVIEDFDLNLSM